MKPNSAGNASVAIRPTPPSSKIEARCWANVLIKNCGSSSFGSRSTTRRIPTVCQVCRKFSSAQNFQKNRRIDERFRLAEHHGWMQEQVPAFWIFLINRIHHSLLAARVVLEASGWGGFRPHSSVIGTTDYEAAGMNEIFYSTRVLGGSRWRNKRISLAISSMNFPSDSRRMDIQMRPWGRQSVRNNQPESSTGGSA
jgi:hypothetical protein